MVTLQNMHGIEIDLRNAVEQSILDPAAFKPVYEAYFSRIYHYCLRRTGNTQEAEDLTSQVFARALGNIGSYRGGSFPAWLFRIAHNLLANHLRSQRDAVALESVEPLGTDDGMLHQMIDAEERQRIICLVAALPEEQRNLLSLRIAGRLSAKEIGAVVGKSEGAVRVAIHRILQQLRAAWEEEEE